ncbi:MAG: winged helix-turn-helix domain-containing protein, partial [Myxococcota bacterium]
MATRWEFDDVVVDERRGGLEVAGTKVALPPQSWRLLLFLLRRPNEVHRREDLLETLWPDTFVGDEALTKLASRLRRALGGRGLVTVPRVGYRLDATVRHGSHRTLQPPPDRFVGRAA